MTSIRNSVQLVGYLSKDPELKVLENGQSMFRGAIATNETYQNKQGQQITNTQWHNLIAWGKMATDMGNILKKGVPLAIKGKLNHSSYEDAQGNKRYYSSVVVNEFMVLNKSDRA